MPNQQPCRRSTAFQEPSQRLSLHSSRREWPVCSMDTRDEPLKEIYALPRVTAPAEKFSLAFPLGAKLTYSFSRDRKVVHLLFAKATYCFEISFEMSSVQGSTVDDERFVYVNVAKEIVGFDEIFECSILQSPSQIFRFFVSVQRTKFLLGIETATSRKAG